MVGIDRVGHGAAAFGEEPGQRPAQQQRDGEDGDQAAQGGQHHRQRDIAAADEGERVRGGAGRADGDDEHAERQLRRQLEQGADGEREQRHEQELAAEAGHDRAGVAQHQGEMAERQREAHAEHDQHQADRDPDRVDEADEFVAHPQISPA